MYTANDLQILSDPLELIRRRPSMFLPRVCGLELAERIVGEASILTNRAVTLLRSKSWWIISAEVDWMTLTPGISEHELFTRLVPFPEAGPNSMRGELLLIAFATEIVTISQGKPRVIKGPVAPEDEIWKSMSARPEWQRVIAFRMGGEEGM